MSCKCQGCGEPYDLDVSVPDDLWNRIRPRGKPPGAGLLCPQCIANGLSGLVPKQPTLRKPSKTLFISIDVGADGPIPGENSMLSLGAAAFHPDHFTPGDDAATCALSTFEVNLDTLDGACPDPDTMKWWKSQPVAWEAARRNTVAPLQAMIEFTRWVGEVSRAHKAKPVLCGYPVTYDFMFVYHYTVRFTGFPAPFGFQGFDIKTLAAERLGVEFKQASKRRMPERWFRGCPPHTHKAVDDALGQGVLLMNMLSEGSGVYSP